MKKRILYFMPDLSLEDTAGNRTRVISMLKYLKSRNFEIDYFGVKDWVPWTGDNAEKIMATGLVDRVIVGERHIPREKPLKRIFCYKIPELIKNKLYGVDSYALNNTGTFYLYKQFNKVLRENKYDIILINYAIWSNLIRNKKYTGQARTIIDTHDFVTIHIFNKNKKLLGRALKEEIKRLNYADEVWAVSVDEYYIFSQFLNNSVELAPIIPLNHPEKPTEKAEKIYDLVYVASDNPYNRASVRWFMDEVYPLLPESIKICIVGRITPYVEDKANITKINFAQNLDEVYQQSRIVICPMVGGTGTKVKVLEAMANKLPVVCTVRGIDGLPNKINNGCLVAYTPSEFADGVIKLLSDRELYEKYSKEGYELYNNYFTTDAVYKNLDRIFGISPKQDNKKNKD